MAEPLSPIDGASVRGFSDTVAARYAELLPGPTVEEPLDLAMLDAFLARLRRVPRAVVLDAGCGTGRMLPVLSTVAGEVVGVDPSPGMLREARHRLPGVRLEIGALDELPLQDSAVDGILAWYSVIHTPADGLDEIVVELRRVLRPGGVVLLGFQCGQGRRRIVGGYGTSASVDAVLHSTDDVAGRLRAAGFRIEAVLDRAAVREAH